MAIALGPSTLALTRDETDLIDYHLARLAGFARRNRLKRAYRDGKARVRIFGSIPPDMRGTIETVVGWPSLAVDAVEERLDWQGWTSPTGSNPFDLDDVYAANGLDVDGSLGHHDALSYGTGFVIVGAGDLGEPNPLVTIESPLNVTGVWDGRLRRLSSALSVDEYGLDGSVQVVTLYGPDENVTATRSGGRGYSPWVVVDRHEHRLGRTPVVMLPNRALSDAPYGRSEINRAVRSHTDNAVRTVLGMEVNREFFIAPQRYAMGADESMFEDGNGNVRTGWEAVMGRYLVLPRDEETGEAPSVGQFPANAPTPFLAQVEGLAKLVAAEIGVPADYLGVVATGNPSSADAIRAMEARLVKKVERRQAMFGRAWKEVALLSLLVRDRALPTGFETIGNSWRDAATPTRAAAADEAVKLVGAGVLPPDSEVTYSRLGLTPQEISTLRNEQRRAASRAAVTALGAAAQAAREAEPEVADLEARTGTDEAA